MSKGIILLNLNSIVGSSWFKSDKSSKNWVTKSIIRCQCRLLSVVMLHIIGYTFIIKSVLTIICVLFHCCSFITFITFSANLFFSYAWFHNYVELCVVLISWGCQNIDPVDPGDKCTNAQYNNDKCSSKSGINWLSLDL